jgi:hypothetical protein
MPTFNKIDIDFIYASKCYKKNQEEEEEKEDVNSN